MVKRSIFPSPQQMACLIPISLLVHQLEEYFCQFPQWFSNLLNAQLSNLEFIVINSIALFIITIVSMSYFFNKNNLILVVMGTVVFVNGWFHFLASLFSLSYTPGTVSGVMLFIPLGFIIYNKILPKLKSNEKILSISIGVLILVMVGMIAINI